MKGFTDWNDKAIERSIARAKRLQERDERRIRITAVCCGAAAVTAAAMLLVGGGADREYTEATVLIHSGDTLWEIAEMYCPRDMDKREYVRLLMTDNDCGADIHSGDVLTVREYEEK